MKQIVVFVLIALSFTGCRDEFSNDVLSVNGLTVYDLDIEKVKKVHDQYALINLTKVLIIDKSGNKTFDVDNESYIKDNNISFRFTDVVGGENDAIYVLASELLDDGTFSIYVLKMDSKGMPLWDSPKVIPITDRFKNTLFDFNRTKNQYYSILDNGYALGKMINNQLVIVVNYQTDQKNWQFQLMSMNTDGRIITKKDFISSHSVYIWTYLLDYLPNNNLVLVQGYDNECYITQYSIQTLHEIYPTWKLEGIKSNPLLFITMTNMVLINETEVLFTGYADRRNNAVIYGNFDVLCLRYNVLSNIVSDTIFMGENNHFELIFNSFIDEQNVVKCIGTKRQELNSAHNAKSSLFQISMDLKTGKLDSTFIIKNRGYEGLYFEETNNNELIIIGSKTDISGKENKQSFFTILKTNDYE